MTQERDTQRMSATAAGARRTSRPAGGPRGRAVRLRHPRQDRHVGLPALGRLLVRRAPPRLRHPPRRRQGLAARPVAARAPPRHQLHRRPDLPLICSSVTMVLAHAAAVEGNRKKLVRLPRPDDPRRRDLPLRPDAGVLRPYFLGWTRASSRRASLRRIGLRQHVLPHHELPRDARDHRRHLPDRDVIRSAMGKSDNGKHDHIEILGLFWHFVDLV